MKSISEVVGAVFSGAVEVFDLQITFADEVVVADYHTGDRRQEHGVGGEVGREVVCRG